VRAPKPEQTDLQKPLRTKTLNRIYCKCLPLEEPAGHRKANCRVTKMNHSHTRPPTRIGQFDPQGRNIKLYRQSSNRAAGGQGTYVPSRWHGSNRSNRSR